MPTYSKTITVKSDIQDTFDFVADFRNLDKWNPHDIVELVTKEPIREGSIFNVKTKLVDVPAMSVLATVKVSPTLYPLPEVVTVTPVTAFPEITNVNTAPVPLPLEVVATLAKPPLFVASLGFVVILDTNEFAVTTNPPEVGSNFVIVAAAVAVIANVAAPSASSAYVPVSVAPTHILLLVDAPTPPGIFNVNIPIAGDLKAS